MIINKEQRHYNFCDENGNVIRKGKELVVSYVNRNKGIDFMTYPIPEEEMFNWQYDKTRNAIHADKEWISWDNKPVRRESTNTLNDYRLTELLNHLNEMYNGQLDSIFEFNLPETWFCDIETAVDEQGFPTAEEARTCINTIALTHFPRTIVWGNKPLTDDEIAPIQKKIENHPNEVVRKYRFEYRYYPNEADMLMDFFMFIQKIPALTGWNFLGYDWLYIYNRATKILGIDMSFLSPTRKFYNYKVSNKFGTKNVQLPMHKIVYDYQMVYEKWDQTIKIKESNKLDFVAEKTLGYKKIEHKLSFKDFYEKEYVDYVFYNSVDTILVEQIDNKIKTANIWYSMGSILHTELMSTFSTINPAEIVMVNELYPEKKVLVPKTSFEEGEQSFVGAFVFPSIPGIYKYIGGLDFASLYPTTIRQFNFSPETYKFTDTTGTYRPKPDEIKSAYGAVYDNTYEGIVPRICTKYYKQRKHSKKLKKQATKDYEYLKQIYDRRIQESI